MRKIVNILKEENMKLSDEIKNKIIEEYSQWTETQYAGKTLEERQKLGAFFTPPELTIQMIEKYDNLDGNILDPAAGAAGLLVACIIAGASPDQIYANEIDKDILNKCKERLNAYCKNNGLPLIPDWHFNNYDATKPEAYEFSEKKKSMPRFGRVRV
jgi:type I restriction-modification system DNA methylase subunit